MPHISGMRPAELEQLLASIASADTSVFEAIPGHVLSEAAQKLSALAGGAGQEWKISVNKYKAVLITKSWCPYCAIAQNLLKALDVGVEVFEVDKLPGMEGDKEKQKEYMQGIKATTGEHRVPQLFISQKYIGEYDDIVDESAGKGKEVLKATVVQQLTPPGLEWKVAVNTSKVVLVTKSWCPYCTIAWNLLKALDVGAEVFEVDKLPGMEGDKEKQGEYMQTVKATTGEHRVPQLFISQKYMGEYDDIVDESGGKGKEVLKAKMMEAIRAGNPDLAPAPSGGGSGG